MAREIWRIFQSFKRGIPHRILVALLVRLVPPCRFDLPRDFGVTCDIKLSPFLEVVASGQGSFI
jgi:hypothetical protein